MSYIIFFLSKKPKRCIFTPNIISQYNIYEKMLARILAIESKSHSSSWKCLWKSQCNLHKAVMKVGVIETNPLVHSSLVDRRRVVELSHISERKGRRKAPGPSFPLLPTDQSCSAPGPLETVDYSRPPLHLRWLQGPSNSLTSYSLTPTKLSVI